MFDLRRPRYGELVQIEYFCVVLELVVGSKKFTSSHLRWWFYLLSNLHEDKLPLPSFMDASPLIEASSIAMIS